MSDPKVAFEMKKVRLPLAVILPIRHIKESQKNVARYKKIVASLKSLGLVEPLVVFPQKDDSRKYLLLDGHLRYFALLDLGEKEVDCLIATDDECFTYNARVNRLNPIQEHKMIMKAVNSGVKPEKIAAALNMSIRNVRSSMSLLDGINAEAAHLLKDKTISPVAIRFLKRVNGVRQIEIAEIMTTANNFSKGYAEALVLGTPKAQLANPAEPKKKPGLAPEEIARMEQEMESVENDLKAIEGSYGENMLNLTFACAYIKRLLENGKVVRFLNGNYRDILTQFESLAATESFGSV